MLNLLPQSDLLIHPSSSGSILRNLMILSILCVSVLWAVGVTGHWNTAGVCMF